MHKEKNKIGDIRGHCPYVVTEKPTPNTSVYDVVKENERNTKQRRLHRNMLLPVTGLPCPLIHKPAQKRREKEKVEVVVPSEESDYSFSSKSSAEKEESKDDPPHVVPNVPPYRRAPGQKGALPPTRAKEAESSLPRATRNRRLPEWYRGDAWVRSQHTFTVLAH